MYKIEDDHLNWCLFSKVQVEELCRQTEKLFSDSTKRWGNGLIYTRTEIWYFPFKVSSHKIKIRNMTKVVKSIIGLILAMFAVVVLDSCNKQENEEAEFTASEQQALGDFQAVMPTARTGNTVYYSTPSVGGYTPNSSRNLPIKGICGTAVGGVIKAQVIQQTNGTFEVEITKQDGGFFSGKGTAYIKSASLCGGIASKQEYSSFSRRIRLSFTATFDIGYTHFYPMIIDQRSGVRYYAEPILVYTSPLYTIKETYTQGESIGTANGVVVKAAGARLLEGNKLSVQCTEFCCRYYAQVYKKNIVNKGHNGGNASEWFGEASAKGLDAFKNSGTVRPRPGDILCLSGGGKGYGHVAIIVEVSRTYIKFAQQNAGVAKQNDPKSHWQYAIGGILSYDYSSNTVSAPNNYEVKGWLRMPMY